MTTFIGSFSSFFKERAAVPVLLSPNARNEIFDEGYLAIKSGFAKLSDVLVEITLPSPHMARIRLLHSPIASYLGTGGWRRIDDERDANQLRSKDKGIENLFEAFPFYQASFYCDFPISPKTSN